MKKPEPTKEKFSEIKVDAPYLVLFDTHEFNLERKVWKYLEAGWVLVGPAMPVKLKDGACSFCQTVVRANVPVK